MFNVVLVLVIDFFFFFFRFHKLEFIGPNEIAESTESCFFEAISHFLSDFALLPDSASSLRYLSPSDLSAHQEARFGVVLRLLQFVVVLVGVYPDFQPPRDIVGEQLYRLLFSFLLSPRDVGLT
jgi:hypothetical protein